MLERGCAVRASEPAAEPEVNGFRQSACALELRLANQVDWDQKKVEFQALALLTPVEKMTCYWRGYHLPLGSNA